ncbi:MAG TPA: sugar phosphate nucleotidyltransferase [Vulgatibacter sp.]|nr:sugar phosphate nucleotidyltransferase [Vulgatibacter sp.]
MIAMILAAGLGTRLRPLTDRIAKPALPILGDTLLGNNLALVAAAGATEVVVNAHHLPQTVAAAARIAADRLGLRLHLSFERPEVRGTGGALVAARPLLDRGEPFLLLNGDVLTDLDPAAAVAAHLASGAATTMVLRPMPPGAPFAPVEVDEGGLVARIAGHGREPAPGEELRPYAFTGIHVLSSAIFDVLPAKGAPCVNRQGHASLVARGARVLGHVQAEGSWSDVGTPERYLQANLDVLEGRCRMPGWPFGAVERTPGAWVHPTAVVEAGAVLRAPCWIGPGARVGAAAAVGPRAALLEGSLALAEVRDAVLPPGAKAGAPCVGRLAGA